MTLRDLISELLDERLMGPFEDDLGTYGRDESGRRIEWPQQYGKPRKEAA